jgi:hypothetical protein
MLRRDAMSFFTWKKTRVIFLDNYYRLFHKPATMLLTAYISI